MDGEPAYARVDVCVCQGRAKLRRAARGPVILGDGDVCRFRRCVDEGGGTERLNGVEVDHTRVDTESNEQVRGCKRLVDGRAGAGQGHVVVLGGPQCARTSDREALTGRVDDGAAMRSAGR